MYTIKLQQYKSKPKGSTRYRFSYATDAQFFARGYQAALRDLSMPHKVYVYDGADMVLDCSDIYDGR